MSNESNEELDYLGEPSFGNEKKSKFKGNNWRIDTEGSHIYRILPPFGLLAKTGKWLYYDAIHWGYAGSDGRKRPFRCIQKKTKGIVTQECPQCKKIQQQSELRESRKKELEAQGKTSESIKDTLKPLDLWLSNFNLDKAFYLNVLNQDSQIGKLKIKIKCKQNLDIVIEKLIKEESVNPIAAHEGVWIDFQRVGMGRHDTTYPVAPVMDSFTDKETGRKMKSLRMAPLSKEVLTRMREEAQELMGRYKELTYDEVLRLVNSNGDPEMVDSIFGRPTVTNTPPPTPQFEVPEGIEDDSAPVETTTSTVSDEEAVLLAQLAQFRANNKNKAATQQTVNVQDLLKAFTPSK